MDEHHTVTAWLEAERVYSYDKFGGKPADDSRPMDWWTRQLDNYLGRVEILGLNNPAGVQAALKLAATAVAFAEAITRQGYQLPEPGHTSGEIVI